MYITLKKLSVLLSLHPNTIYKLIADGMPNIKIGKNYRFNFEEVDLWLTERSTSKLKGEE